MAVCTYPAAVTTLDQRWPGKWDLTNSALHDALQVSMKEQLVRALGKTLSNTWEINANASSVSTANATAVQDDRVPSAAPLPEELFSIEEDVEPTTQQQEQQQDTTSSSNNASMSFLSASERKRQQREVKVEGGRSRSSLSGQTPPPPEFFCPISHCLMMEPVKILNTGVTINRTSAQAWMRTRSQVCPVTGQALRGWVAMESNDALRERIEQWVAEQGINISLLENAAVMMHDLCAQVAH